MVVIEAGTTVNQDITLVLSKYGPVEQKIHNDLVNRGFRVTIINTRDDEVKRGNSKAVLLLDDTFEALVISSLFEDTLNPRGAYVLAINRAALFRELSRLGYPTPEISVALNPNVVGKVIRGGLAGLTWLHHHRR